MHGVEGQTQSVDSPNGRRWWGDCPVTGAPKSLKLEIMVEPGLAPRLFPPVKVNKAVMGVNRNAAAANRPTGRAELNL